MSRKRKKLSHLKRYTLVEAFPMLIELINDAVNSSSPSLHGIKTRLGASPGDMGDLHDMGLIDIIKRLRDSKERSNGQVITLHNNTPPPVEDVEIVDLLADETDELEDDYWEDWRFERNYGYGVYGYGGYGVERRKVVRNRRHSKDGVIDEYRNL